MVTAEKDDSERWQAVFDSSSETAFVRGIYPQENKMYSSPHTLETFFKHLD